MKRLVILLAVPLLLGAGPQTVLVNDLAWLTGRWSSETGDKWAEEDWNPPRGGQMMGTGQSGTGERVRFFEFLRIAPDTDGVLTYWASPNGGKPVPFRLLSRQSSSAIFTNAGHDYPQRITYSRTGGILIAETALIDGSRAERWVFRRRR